MQLATLHADDRSLAVVVVNGAAAPITAGGGEVYPDVGAVLRAGDAGREHALVAADAEPRIALHEHRLLRPVLRPGAVICVGLNYRAHILEMGRPLPEHPALFSKLPRALTDPYGDIELPPDSDRVDYEGELAVVIGRPARNVSAGDAWRVVGGVTALNDVTMRDFQRRSPQWFAGKTFEASTPFGPVMTTIDEPEDLEQRELLVRVNGEVRQRALVADLVFDVPALIADVSRIVGLEPGDIIATGTPGGVGDAMQPPRYLQDGDEVEVSITGIGAIRNRFRRPG